MDTVIKTTRFYCVLALVGEVAASAVAGLGGGRVLEDSRQPARPHTAKASR
jgi:hypothetical protein